jgi:hypothetical protein
MRYRHETSSAGCDGRERAQEGRFANRHDTLGAGCDGRDGAQDECTGRGRRSRSVLTPRRWCQVLEKQASQARRRQESPVSGETTKQPLKPLARGMPDCFGEPVVTNSCVYLHSHARLWVHRAPGIPCALSFRGERFCKTRAQIRAAGMQGCDLLFETLRRRALFDPSSSRGGT